ncbi:hypothetical protein [Anderseniella sp. Alg231-50]|uniref:hypothetical protein n=1 Tax=Anderseniella sp. Alg231-50 TaxID=1922226 RepID=UPI00307C2BF0
MNVHSTDLSAKSSVPVARIVEARGSLPHCTLSFEVEFEVEELEALSDLVSLFARAGLICDGLRYRRDGSILVRLCDSDRSDFQLMDAALDQLPSLKMVRWTTVLSKPAD